MKKIYIDDFEGDLNYHRIAFQLSDVVLNERVFNELKKQMERDYINKLYRFDYIVNSNRLFYIANCDLQNVTIPELNQMVTEQFEFYMLMYDEAENKFYFRIEEE